MALTPAERQRRKRRRDRRRETVVSLTINLLVVEALIQSMRLSEADALDAGKVNGELADVLHEWARQWLQ